MIFLILIILSWFSKLRVEEGGGGELIDSVPGCFTVTDLLISFKIFWRGGGELWKIPSLVESNLF